MTVDDPADFEEGRYLYCVVRAPAGVAADDPPELDVEGLEGGTVRLLAPDGGGEPAAVVQSCDSLFDSDAPEEIRRWLVRHQTVVDAAGEAFGTPLPCRFDTVLVGDDDRVREWLADEREHLRDALAEFEGRWEYRVEVVDDEELVREDLAEEDERLRELAEEREAADEGRGFLVEKQYERRLEELRTNRRLERADDLVERLEPHADAVEELGERRSMGLGVGGDADGEAVARLALLASSGAEDAIGEELSDVADAPGVEVRFTGPWPPYSFAPTIGGEESGPERER